MEDRQTETCEAIGLSCHPALGLYSRDLYYILPSTPVSDSVPPPLPFRLSAELQRPELEGAKISFGTVMSDGRFLKNERKDKAAVNVLFHSYAFYDAKEGSDHKTFAPAAVYLPDCFFSTFCTPQASTGDFLCTNPSSIFTDRCRTEIYLHPREECMCCSPDNAKVLITVSAPVVVFYTLCLIPFAGRIVRGNVTRHIVVMDWTAGISEEVMGTVQRKETTGLRKKIIDMVEMQDPGLGDLLQVSLLGLPTEGEVTDEGGSLTIYQRFLHYLTWSISGQPQISNYGSTVYQRHISAGESPTSQAWLRQLTVQSALDVYQWLQMVS